MRLILALLPIVLVLSASPVSAQQKELEQRGKALYRMYCQACHGKSGAGDGQTAEYLKIPPTDLTRLTAENDGEFPFESVYRVIDGRQRVRTHGPTQMPIWGMSFQDSGSDSNQEDMVRGRVLQLIEYLKSIQK